MHFEKERSFDWLLSQKITEVKEISRVLLACQLWDVKTDLSDKLIAEKDDGNWNRSLRDTSRAISALVNTGNDHSDIERWVLTEQKNGAWNNDVYDTTYALLALAETRTYNQKACKWLVDNYSSDWEFPGTTALIISALIRQSQISQNESDTYSEFIVEHARWILSQRDKNGAWKSIATSNICIQALMLAGYHEELNSDIQWLLGKMNDNGSWGKDNGNVTATALSLISLAQFIKNK